MSLRLTDASGKQVTQSDQTLAPARGLPYIPFEKPITSVYFIPIPVQMAPGEYTLRAVPYLPGEEISPQVTTPVRVLAR